MSRTGLPKLMKTMVIVAKQRVPQCGLTLIAQLQICGTQNLKLKSNYEPMLFSENFKQLCTIEPLTMEDLSCIEKTLSDQAKEEWPKEMLSSRRDLKDFVTQQTTQSFEEVINQNDRKAMGLLQTGFDYGQKKKVHIVFRTIEVTIAVLFRVKLTLIGN